MSATLLPEIPVTSCPEWAEYAAAVGNFAFDVDRMWLAGDGKRLASILPDGPAAKRFETIIADIDDLYRRFCMGYLPKASVDEFNDGTRALVYEARALVEAVATRSAIFRLLMARWDDSRAIVARTWKAAQQ